MEKEMVILVDTDDNEIGEMEKLEAHKKACLHRALSVFIFNSKGEMLLQKRASHKYHSPSLWTNTCCSHPYPKEDSASAASRRLMQEMGLTAELSFVYKFIYKADFENGLTEYEYDNVFTGISDESPTLNPEEACEWKYITKEALLTDIEAHPEQYTEWFKLCIPRIYEELALQHSPIVIKQEN